MLSKGPEEAVNGVSEGWGGDWEGWDGVGDRARDC